MRCRRCGRCMRCIGSTSTADPRGRRHMGVQRRGIRCGACGARGACGACDACLLWGIPKNSAFQCDKEREPVTAAHSRSCGWLYSHWVEPIMACAMTGEPNNPALLTAKGNRTTDWGNRSLQSLGGTHSVAKGKGNKTRDWGNHSLQSLGEPTALRREKEIEPETGGITPSSHWGNPRRCK